LFPSTRHADPRLTLAQRLDRLNDTLQSLGQRLKESIAEAVSSAVSGAVRDALCGLLGTLNEPDRFDDRPWHQDLDEPSWRNPDRPLWADNEEFVPRDRPSRSCRRQVPSRWSEALGVAVQAGVCWLRHQPRRRPVLTAVVVALAAGLTALLAGPAVGAGAGVLASTAGLLLTADAIDPALDEPSD